MRSVAFRQEKVSIKCGSYGSEWAIFCADKNKFLEKTLRKNLGKMAPLSLRAVKKCRGECILIGRGS